MKRGVSKEMRKKKLKEEKRGQSIGREEVAQRPDQEAERGARENALAIPKLARRLREVKG